ncbi:MAG: EamA family transporter [Candidatus Paceibacterota bacterium]
MTWILLASVAQFFNAIVAIIDKYLVTDEKAIPCPFVYAFYSCLVTGGWVVVYIVSLIPGLEEIGVLHFSNIETPTIQVGMSFLAAYTFFMALVSLYDGLKHADASDVMPVIGAVSAISTFGMSYLFLGTRLSPNFIWGILLLAVGTFLVSQVRFSQSVVLHTVHSGLFFALHYIAMKGLFQETSFDDGFFWSRVCFVLFALSLLLVPAYYEKIKTQTKATSAKTGFLVLHNKILAGVAAFMLLKATDWGDVAVVQALDGLKFVFILFMSIAFGRFIPASAGENDNDWKTIFRKFLYVAVICIGFVILFR